MQFSDREEEVPNLWIRRRGFGTRQAATGCGIVSASSEAVRQAMREARKGAPLKVSETVEEARQDLEAYVIHTAKITRHTGFVVVHALSART